VILKIHNVDEAKIPQAPGIAMEAGAGFTLCLLGEEAFVFKTKDPADLQAQQKPSLLKWKARPAPK
jgi:hypothetical protein